LAATVLDSLGLTVKELEAAGADPYDPEPLKNPTLLRALWFSNNAAPLPDSISTLPRQSPGHGGRMRGAWHTRRPTLICMSYELAWRFWSFASDKDGRARRAVQHRPPDYPGIIRLQLMLAVLRATSIRANLLTTTLGGDLRERSGRRMGND
jgi:hypothetical protein